MAIFTAAATFLLAGTFLAGSAFATGALAIGLGFAAQFGLSYAVKAIAGNQNQPSAATDSFGIQGTLRAGGAVPRCFPLGWTADPGQLVYANYWGDHDQTPNAYFTQVIKVSDLPGCQLLKIWVGGEPCTIDLDPAREHPYGNPLVEYRKDNEDHLWVKYYDGTQTAADPFLVSAVSSVDRPYAATRVGTGCAYAILTSLTADTLFTGFPEFLFELSSIPLYDPSQDDTVGGSGPHRYDDPSTWGGDGDGFPAVQAYNVLRGIRYEGAWVYGLQNATAGTLPVANWIAQVAKCRAPIDGDDGPEPTYRCGGMINVNTQPANALEPILTACQGKISELGGFFKLRLGAPDSPTFSFTDDDLLSSEPQVFKPFLALADSVNGIQATYPDPTQGWTSPATAPAYYRTDLEVRDGNRRLMANPFFARVPYPAQVQRLQKSAIEAGQRARSHIVSFPPRYWPWIEPGEVGAWTSVRNGYVDKSMIIDASVDAANLSTGANISETDPDDYDWDHATEFRPVASGPTSIPRPSPQGVLDWAADPWTLPDAAGIGRRPAIRLSWDGSLPGVAGVQYEVRLAEDGSDVTKGRTDQLAAGAIIVSQSLIPDEDYEVRGQYLPSAPRDMLWSAWLPVTTPDVRLGLDDFNDGVRYQATSLHQQNAQKLADLESLVAGALVDVAARSHENKEILNQQSWDHRIDLIDRITVGDSLVSASVEIVRTVAISATAAIAALTISVGSSFATVNDRLTTAESNITINATAISTANSAVAALSASVTASLAATNANVTANTTSIATNASAIASLSTSVTASIGSITSSVSSNTTAITTLNGYAAAQVTVKTNVNGYIVGTNLINGGAGLSAFIVQADKFQIQLPGYNGSSPVSVFTTGTVNGVTSIGITGNVFLDGTLYGSAIRVGTLNANAIVAGSIDVTRLAVNSVDINNIIAGAATKYYFTTYSAQPTGVTGTFNPVSGFGCTILSGLALVTFNLGVNWPSLTAVNLIVDGSTVKTWSLTGTFAAALTWFVNGLSSGAHTFGLQFVTGASPDTWELGQFYVQDLRR
jgi:hypothetical protein